MNLIDLVTRKDRSVLEAPEGLQPCIHECEGMRMNSLRLRPGDRILLGGFRSFDELRPLPRDLGWFLTARGQGSRRGRLSSLKVSVEGEGGRTFPIALRRIEERSPRWWPIGFDWPVEIKEEKEPRLALEASPEGGEVVLGISDAVDLRAPLLAYARGDGVEIGPGLSPQVIPAPGVEVKYIERSPIEEWVTLYQKKDPRTIPAEVRALWERYRVADAQKLEGLEDQSLDFIFSSHLFEHLVNPLGTLERWRGKLRLRGHVIGIVPDAHNCFDLRHPLSTALEWLREWECGTWSYQEEHYRRWCRFTEPRATPESLIRRGYSIHAHYYTPATFGWLLEMAVVRLGFRNFHIRSARNRKDFGWLLER